MRPNFKLLLATCILGLLTACGNNTSTSTDASNGFAVPTSSPLGNAPSSVAQSANAFRPPVNADTAETPMKARDMNAAPTASLIALGAPVASQTAAIKNQALDSTYGKPLQIGFGRDVAQTSTEANTNQVLKWQATSAGGQVAALNFNSTGAKGVRIGLLVTNLPASATLRFYAKGAALAYEVKGDEVLRVLAANLSSGDQSAAGRTYWGPVLDGTDATLEIELPAGVANDAVGVSIPSVSHLFMSMKDNGSAISAQAVDNDLNQGLSCQVDVSCTTPLPAASNAVVWLTYKRDGIDYQCSGTLLNDSTNSGTPYVLTANHCIANQTVASTLSSLSRYRSSSCNANGGNYFATATTGASLLYTAYNTDSTLLRLYGNPQVGVLFAGWDASANVALSTAVTNIHHPRGDAQRISRGSVNGYYNRNPNIESSFPYATAANSSIFGVTLTSGLTEPGSSGSGLFKGADNNPQLIGQLYGGSTPSCTVPADNVYGRFDAAFKVGLRIWLSPDAPAPNPIRQPVYRFYVPKSGVYFYTIYASERDSILATLSNVFTYEGIAFYASPTPTAGFNAIYRFRNTINGSYLYTISDVEKASILQNYPQYVLEGTAWYAESGAVGDGKPLYRFRTNNNTHIYTAYESEKASIFANYPSFVFEGPAYYVKLTP